MRGFFNLKSAIDNLQLGNPPGPHHIMNRFGLQKKIFHLVKRDHTGGIAERLTRFGMSLEEEAIAARGHSGSTEMGDILRTSSSRVLTRDTIISDDMGRIKDHRAANLLHDRNRTEV